MIVKYTKKIILGRVPVSNLRSGNVEMMDLSTDEMAFFRSLMKIGTDENKAIYSIYISAGDHRLPVVRVIRTRVSLQVQD